jgi:hypothetical protein
MGLTREKLVTLGLNEEQIEDILSDHMDAVSTIQNDAKKFKADYEKERADFEIFRNEQKKKDLKVAKERAFRNIIGAAGIAEKRIDAVLRISNLDDLELDEAGIPQNCEILTEKIREEFPEFIVTSKEMGATVMTPPDMNDARDLGKLDMAAYIAERKNSKKG